MALIFSHNLILWTTKLYKQDKFVHRNKADPAEIICYKPICFKIIYIHKPVEDNSCRNSLNRDVTYDQD